MSETQQNSQENGEESQQGVWCKEPWIYTIANWREVISTYLPDFKGDIKNAARLLFSFSRGMKILIDRFAAKEIEFNPPLIVMSTGVSDRHVLASYHESSNSIVMSEELISHISEMDIFKMANWSRDDGEIVFKGRLIDYFRSIGLEECYHALYRQQKDEEYEEVDALSMSISEYDARDEEYRALRLQVRVSQEQKDPDVTQQFLAQRLENARQVRRTKHNKE